MLFLNQEGFELFEIIISFSSGQGSSLFDLLHPLAHLDFIPPQTDCVEGFEAISDRIDLGMT